MIDFLLDAFEATREKDALVWRDAPVSYGWLLERVRDWRARLEREGIPPGTIAAVEADFSPNAVALFLALAERSCVFVPLTSSVAAKKAEFLEVAEVEAVFSIDERDEARLTHDAYVAKHPFYAALRERGHPGHSREVQDAASLAASDLVPAL